MAYNTASDPNLRLQHFSSGGNPLGLVEALMAIRRSKMGEEEMRLRNEESRRREQRLLDEEALKKVGLRQSIAAGTDLTTAPQVEKQVTEGVNVSPEEAAYMGGTETAGFKPKETVTTSVPNAPRSASIQFGGEMFDIPLKYKQDIEGEAAAKSERELELKQREDMVYVPGVGMVNKALIPLFSARESRGAKRIERSIDRGDVVDVYYTDGTMESQPKGAAPKAPSETEKGSWVTDDKGQRVWKTAADIAAAPPGTYSDVRPPTAKVIKADPAKLKMAITALGGPGVENSLWDLATKINVDKGMMAALKGVGKRKITEMAPEMASQSGDPQLKMINMYNTAIQGFASSIAKAFGESGVLTNQDIARATGLFPKSGESPDTTLQKLERVKMVMESGMQDPAMFREIFGRDPKAAGGAQGDGTPERPIVLE